MPTVFAVHMSYSLKLLKGGYIGKDIGESYRGCKGDSRSSDYSSHGLNEPRGP